MPSTGVINHDSCTVIFAVCANGTVILPMFIFKSGSKKVKSGDDYKAQFGPDAPKLAKYYANENAYNTNEMMVEWIKHFNEQTKPGRKLLVMVSATTPSFFLDVNLK